jgi:two-component system sensor histidine kinase KdpD
MRSLTGTRTVLGLGLGAAGLVIITPILTPNRSLTSAALLYLVPVLAVAVVGGVWPALATAVASDLLLNWFFVPPYHTLAVANGENVLALLVYVLVAVTVSVAVNLAARQRAAATRNALEAQRLAVGAARAEELAEVDRLRIAILAAVGHDLRTPLASTKAAVSSLRAPDVAFTPEDSAELLATIEESTDRLGDLVENLLAMSRLQAGVLSVQPVPVALDEVVARALLSGTAGSVRVAVRDDLPLVRADPGLLERTVANLVDNATRVSTTVEVNAVREGDRVLLRIVDRGPGIPAADRERIFAPFQRLGDHTADGGLGLGLAIARGFTEAMGGAITPSDTPGGGITMTVALPIATGSAEHG